VLTGDQTGHFWSFELWNYSGTVRISTAAEINVNPFLPDVFPSVLNSNRLSRRHNWLRRSPAGLIAG